MTIIRAVHAWLTDIGSPPLERPVSATDLQSDRVASSRPTFGFFLLLITAATIASLGLIADSTAVVVGAMIVAPLMNPILSISFGSVTMDGCLIRRSLGTIALGVLVVLGTAFLIASFLPVNIVGREIMARTSPNLIDLGIAIAAGIAGAFSLTRSRVASSIAGVAIAVALVPPLCVVGIGMAVGSDVGSSFGPAAEGGLGSRVAAGSFLLFLANLIGIELAASVTFLSQGYGSARKAWLSIALAVVLTCLIAGPLSGAFQEFRMKKRVDIEISRIGSREPQIWNQVQVRYLDVQWEDRTAVVTMIITAPEGLISSEDLSVLNKTLGRSLRPYGVQGLRSTIKLIPVKVTSFYEEYR